MNLDAALFLIGPVPTVLRSNRTSRIIGRGGRRMKARRTLAASRKHRRCRGLSNYWGRRRSLPATTGIFRVNFTTACPSRGAGCICYPS